MDRREIEAHAGYNVVIAKLYESHDGLREIIRSLEKLAAEGEAHIGKPAPETWAKSVERYGKIFVEIMRAHHGTEDENIFPYMTGWFDFDPSELDREHHELNKLLPELERTLASLSGGAIGAGELRAFADVARRMRELVDAHFDHEERTVVVELLRLTSEDIQRMFLGKLPT